MRRTDPRRNNAHRTTAAIFALALCACLTSCTPGKPAADPGPDVAASPTPPAVATTPVAHEPEAPALAGADAPLPTEARQVVVDYYAAINARDYRKAYASWSDDGAASGQSFEHFSGGYANTESVVATVGEAIDEEGAAGSRYISVPVELQSRLFNGTTRAYKGRFALRAVVADGATAQQRRWHLSSAEMQRIP